MTQEFTLTPAKAGKLQYHEFADIFPLVQGEEFDDFCADIKAEGLHEPIVFE